MNAPPLTTCDNVCLLGVGAEGWMDGESGEEEIKARRRRRKAKLGKGIN